MRHLDTSVVIDYLRGNQTLAARLVAYLPEVALANDAVLVTHNAKHFENIEGLRLEDWLA